MMEKKQNKCGYLLHAFPSKEIDYGKLSVCSALSIKTNLTHNNVTLISEKGTVKWMKESIPTEVLCSAFDKIIISNDKFPSLPRTHYDSPWTQFKSQFNNHNRVLSYKYSPYDETIILDVDYLMMNNHFDSVWGSQSNLLINKKCVDLKNKTFGDIEERRLNQYGIPLYWATAVYFKKNEFTKMFFDLLEYIREEYNFFQFLYGFKTGVYRNDFSFSIATHILNGALKNGITSFNHDTIMTAYQQDTIADILNYDEFIFYSHEPNETWKNTLVNTKGMNVHIMNKRELLRVSDKYIKMCMEKLNE